MSNSGVTALSTMTPLDPAVKLGTGLSTPASHTQDAALSPGVTPLPFQTLHQVGTTSPSPDAKGSSASTVTLASDPLKHSLRVLDIKPIDLRPPPDLSVGYSVSKDGRAIQVKMTNRLTGEVVRSFDIKTAELAKTSKTNIILKGSQIDAKS